MNTYTLLFFVVVSALTLVAAFWPEPPDDRGGASVITPVDFDGRCPSDPDPTF